MTQFELHNLADDIAEQHNLAEKEPGRLEAMKKTLAKLHAEIDAEAKSSLAYSGQRLVYSENIPRTPSTGGFRKE